MIYSFEKYTQHSSVTPSKFLNLSKSQFTCLPMRMKIILNFWGLFL